MFNTFGTLYSFYILITGNKDLIENGSRGSTSNFSLKFFNKNKDQPLCIVKPSERTGNGKPQVQCVFITSSPKANNRVVDSFKEAGIVPDLIDVAPTGYLPVKFPTGVEARLGNTLTPTLVQYQPRVTWRAQKGALYTLMLVDPDVPSKADPSMGAARHWLVVNIPGNNVSKGQIVAQYFGSSPDPGTGLHRYTLLVFKQNGRITTNEYFSDNASTNQTGRVNFNVRQYIQMNNLGKSLFGNYYLAAFDQTAIAIRQKLGVPIVLS